MGKKRVSKSYAVYRFYRNEFTPLVWSILIAVLFGLILTGVVFSPVISHGNHDLKNREVKVAIIAGVTEEEELNDSEPLFLPTVWNLHAKHLQTELKTPFLPSFSFGGLKLLERFDETGFSAIGSIGVERIENVFSPGVWEITRGFGVGESWKDVIASVDTIHIRVSEINSGMVVNEAILDLKEMSDDKMLLSSVEIICYGAPDLLQMFVVQSSGNADFDKNVLDSVREWTKKHLRSSGAYLIVVGF